MQQFSGIDPIAIRIRLLKILDETLNRYQAVLNKLNELQSTSYLSQNSAKSNQFVDKGCEELKSKSRWLKKYLQSLTNALIQIDNGSYFFRKQTLKIINSDKSDQEK